MTALLPRKFSYLSRLCLLVVVNVACSLPIAPLRRSSEETFARLTDAGFSNSPRVLELQLPLKLASKEDLVAWAKYVMGLMASKINITLTTVKDSIEEETSGIMKPLDMSRLPLEEVRSKPGIKSSKTSAGPSFNGGNINFEVPSIHDINSGSPFEMKGEVTAPEWTKGSINSPLTTRERHFSPPQYSDFTRKPLEIVNDISRRSNAPIPPSNMYLPLPVKTSESARFINNMFTTGHLSEGAARNVSTTSRASTLPDSISATRKSATLNQQLENVTLMNENKSSHDRNVSAAIKPIISLPFEAVITITREEKPEAFISDREKENYLSMTVRDPPDEFPPYFEKNYTITNESGQVNVILEDVGDDVTEGVEKDDKSMRNGNSKRDRSKNTRSGRRQAAALSGLIKMLESRRKSGDNSLPSGLRPPASKPATATKFQRAQLLEQQDDDAQDRRNETSQAQEFEDGDYDDENGGMGGSIQSLLELLPLVAPILEDLSDPGSDTDIGELLQAAIPILEGLLEGDGDGPAPDLPAIFVPILLNIIRGRNGEGSDANALLGPLIQLAAPFIGPIIGPLIGPLSQQSSNPPGEGGGSNLGTIVQAVAGPLSMPTGPGKMSPFSTLVAGVVASLSKELVNGKDGLDLKSLVSAVVSGSIWGASAALSAPKDTAYAPTSYGGGGGYGGNGYGVPANSVNPFALIGSSIKDIFTSVLKVSSTLIQALSAILGASSQGSPKSYGPPPNYSPPTSYQAQQKYPTTTRAPQSQRNRGSRKQTAG